MFRETNDDFERARKLELSLLKPFDSQENIDYCLEKCPYPECINCLETKKIGKNRRCKLDATAFRREIENGKTDAELSDIFNICKRTVKKYRMKVIGDTGESDE